MGNCCIREEITNIHTIYQTTPCRQDKINNIQSNEDYVNKFNTTENLETVKANFKLTPRLPIQDVENESKSFVNEIFDDVIKRNDKIELENITSTPKSRNSLNIDEQIISSRAKNEQNNYTNHNRINSNIDYISYKGSFIKDCSQNVSDNLSLLQEKENFFPESKTNSGNKVEEQEEEINNNYFNILNNFEITNPISVNSTMIKIEKQSSITEEEIKNLENKNGESNMNNNSSSDKNRLENQEDDKDEIESVPIQTIVSQRSTNEVSSNQFAFSNRNSVIHQKSSTNTILTAKNSSLKNTKRPFTRISQIEKLSLNDENSHRRTVTSEYGNLSSQRKENIDISRNALKLKQFEKILHMNTFVLNATSDLSSKRNKDNHNNSPISTHGNTPAGSKQKKITLNKYKYLFSDVSQNKHKSFLAYPTEKNLSRPSLTKENTPKERKRNTNLENKQYKSLFL